jgi:multimeric flavodoxin WrbA
MYGHIAKLASSIRAGVERAGCDCRVFQVAETLSSEVLAKMHAPSKINDIPVIRPDQLPEADGFLFGMPTRFGTAPTQMKNLFDACGAHWLSDALIGKPVRISALLSIGFFIYFQNIGWCLLFNSDTWWWSRDNSSFMCTFF